MFLTVLVIALPTSNFVMNMMWVFMLANWLVEGDFSAKWQRAKESRLLHAVVLLFALHLVGLLWSTNLAYGLDDIRKKLPLLAVPLVVLTSERIEGFHWVHLQRIYIVTVIVVAIIGVARFIAIPDLPYRDLNPWISHIRFSLNVCLALVLLCTFFNKGGQHAALYAKATSGALVAMGKAPLPEATQQRWQRLATALHKPTIVASIVFLIGFLLLQQSYTGFVVLAIMLVVAAVSMRNKAILATLAVVTLGVVALTAHHTSDYYSLKSLSSEPLLSTTANGTPYTHHEDGFVERGGYVNNYICDEELYREWPRHSQVALDSVTETGYPLYGALVRYLNCLNLPKDSLGICQLQPADIAAIERGIANPTYLRQGSLDKFFDQMLYEVETYRQGGSIKGFTMLERLELWQNGWHCIKESPWLGVGTGDVVDIEHARLEATQSTIAGTTKHIHNQYLTLLLAFGLVGLAIIAVAFARALRQGPRMPIENLMFVTLVLVSFINEDTLETLAGVMLVVLWGSLFNRQRNSCTNTTH